MYLVQIEDNSMSGRNTEFPGLGILAYMQRLHLVDINHEVYAKLGQPSGSFIQADTRKISFVAFLFQFRGVLCCTRP